jgi:putative DNA primase/helicase
MGAEAIAVALGGSYTFGDWWRCRCPVHNSSGPTLAIRNTSSGPIFRCHAGCSRGAIEYELERLGLLDPDREQPGVDDPVETERRRAEDERRRQKRTAAALDLWNNETVDPRGSVIERYWASRGLSPLSIPPTIRASRSWLRHPENGIRPAMVALVEHVDRRLVAIHRTYLAIDGSCKAAFRSPRLSLGPVGGAAIRLADASEHEPLIIGEGIETVASVMVATGLPGWAALSAGGIERLMLPMLPLAATVIIAADHDLNGLGERAARSVARQWLAQGRRVRIALPPVAGSDWNDVLLNKDIGGARDAAA